MLDDACTNFFFADIGGVLGADENGMHPFWLTVSVFDGDL